MSDKCKRCGYCSHCGRSDSPYYPVWTYTYGYPHPYTYPRVTYGYNQTNGISGGIQSSVRQAAEYGSLAGGSLSDAQSAATSSAFSGYSTPFASG